MRFKARHGMALEHGSAFAGSRSERAPVTWPETVDQALGFRWIDGVRQSVVAGVTEYALRPGDRPASDAELTCEVCGAYIRRGG